MQHNLIHGQGADNLKRILNLIAAVGIFISLLVFPEAAAGAVKNGFDICSGIILPALFPFFIAVNLINELGFSAVLANAMYPLGAKSLGVSGSAVSAFVIGLIGGYPLGAVYIAGLRERGLIGCDEASKLLICCNNSGPAFIIGAAGVGVFGSAAVGFFLYAVHIIAAIVAFIIISPKSRTDICYDESILADISFSRALTLSVKAAAESAISICAFIVAFSAFAGILDSADIIPSLSGRLSLITGAPIGACRALLYGLLELGNGIGSMSGFGTTPHELALASFIISWGGLSVHFQTLSVTAKTDIKTARYMIGRFFTAAVAASIALPGAALFF